MGGWGRYARPGLDVLIDDDQLLVDFEAVRDKATLPASSAPSCSARASSPCSIARTPSNRS
ncbi:hypothetical protein DB30_02547 [Enhygromyxa salina]|uniref:Uncharacterized protein n=1 Tax=Enhygromyxa salina TaxID=215803 RepID=A0A0C1Z2S0_9BACT|nr:hypothetical protein DB30_02547 [Enhygromyxa salina]